MLSEKKLNGLDTFDLAILRQLQRDGRLTSAELGERIGLSASAAHRRVKLLEQAGVITGYTAILSDEAVGRPSTVFVAVTLQDQRQETLDRFERALSQYPEITECYLIAAESDYLLKVMVPAEDGYERIHRDVLSALPGVRRVVSQFAIRPVFRRNTAPPRMATR